mgnify:CR=1 FL=1
MFSNNHYCKTLLFLKKKGTEEWEKKKKKETFLLVSLHPVPRQNEQEVEKKEFLKSFFRRITFLLVSLLTTYLHTCFDLESYFNGGILKFFTLLLRGNIKKLYSADLHLRLTWSDSLLQMFFSSAVLLSIRLALRSCMAFFVMWVALNYFYLCQARNMHAGGRDTATHFWPKWHQQKWKLTYDGICGTVDLL